MTKFDVFKEGILADKKKAMEKSKQDMNFLNNPMWIVSPRVASKGVDGIYRFTVKYADYTYEVRSTYKLPAYKDRIILFYLLALSQQRGWECEFTDLSISDIIRGCGFSKNRQNYQRIIESLKRWSDMVYDFDNGFFDGDLKEHRSEKFHILSYKNDGKKLSITLNTRFINIMEASKFYRWINFDICKKLGNATALRLYELLTANLQDPSVEKEKRRGKPEWKLRTETLAERCGLIDRYPSNVKKRIDPALEILRERGHLDFKVKYFKKNGIHYTEFSVGDVYVLPDTGAGEEKGVVEPDKVPDIPTSVDLLDLSGQGHSWQKILNMIPRKYMKSNKGLGLLKEFYDSEGFQRTQYLVSYVLSKRPRRFWGFLQSCLNGDIEDAIREISTVMAKNFEYAIWIRKDCGHEAFVETCSSRGINEQDALEWAMSKGVDIGDPIP